MVPDTQLAAARAGGAQEFGAIVDRYRDSVFGVALSRRRNFHDAEDTAQTVFVEAFDRLASLRDPERLGAWLRGITLHRCIDQPKSGMAIYPSQLLRAVTEEELRKLFAVFGRVSSVTGVRDRVTHQPNGFAIAQMPDTTQAEGAIASLNHKVLKGQAVAVSRRRPHSGHH